MTIINMTTARVSLLTLLLLLGFAGFSVTGCDRQGPAEEMGEKIDDAVENTSDKIDDAVDNAKDAVGN